MAKNSKILLVCEYFLNESFSLKHFQNIWCELLLFNSKCGGFHYHVVVMVEQMVTHTIIRALNMEATSDV